MAKARSYRTSKRTNALLNALVQVTGKTQNLVIAAGLRRYARSLSKRGKIPASFMALSPPSTPSPSKPKRKGPPPRHSPRVD